MYRFLANLSIKLKNRWKIWSKIVSLIRDRNCAQESKWSKIWSFQMTQFLIFDKIFDFWPQFPILIKFSIFKQNDKIFCCKTRKCFFVIWLKIIITWYCNRNFVEQCFGGHRPPLFRAIRLAKLCFRKKNLQKNILTTFFWTL